eukprot:TRINITY_DN2210_c0_g1_i1.p1 TRINITY_DN2210_c0_g1~~TRINITY_DN2210_c0_g1_i1.p1  ORF type:complete len:321 (+),score=97.51 TRINITY_DN2210_c0_g1_i1:152-1114(+)
MTYCPTLDLGPSGSIDDVFAPDLSGHTCSTIDDLPVRKVGKTVRKPVVKRTPAPRAPPVIKTASGPAVKTRDSRQDSTPTLLTKKNVTTTSTTTTPTTPTPTRTPTPPPPPTTTTTTCGPSAVKGAKSAVSEPVPPPKHPSKKNKGKGRSKTNTPPPATTTTTTTTTSTTSRTMSSTKVQARQANTTTTITSTRTKRTASQWPSISAVDKNKNIKNKKKKTVDKRRASNSRYQRPTMRALCRGVPRKETIESVANMDYWAREWEDRKYLDAQSRFPHRRGSRSFRASWNSCHDRRPYQRGTIRHLLKEERAEYVTRPRFY